MHRADHARGRARKCGTDRVFTGALDGHQPAGGLIDPDGRDGGAFDQAGLEAFHVACDGGLEIGVQNGCRKALIFAELRLNAARQ